MREFPTLESRSENAADQGNDNAMPILDRVKAVDPDVLITSVTALESGARCDPHGVPDLDGFRVPVTANDEWATVRRGMPTSACRRAHPSWGSKHRDSGIRSPGPPRSGSANEILVVTRENVPDGTLYFLQHRWRLCDYVRTPRVPALPGPIPERFRVGGTAQRRKAYVGKSLAPSRSRGPVSSVQCLRLDS